MIQTIKFRYLRNISNFHGYKKIGKEKVPVKQFGEPLQFDKINIFIGENGSGKSSIIDAIRSLKENQLIPSITRENPPNQISPLFHVSFSDGSSVTIEFLHPDSGRPSSIEMKRTFNLTIIFGSVTFTENISLPKYPIQKTELNWKIPNSERIKFWDSNLSLNIPRLRCTQLFSELNQYISNFVGVSHYDANIDDKETRESYAKNNPCFSLLADDIVQIIPSDDSSMVNYLQYEFLPHGWRQLISLFNFLKGTSENDICLIEEPETHLHPKLQKIMMNVVRNYIKEKKLQVFISTHSATIINSCSNKNVALYHTQGHQVTRVDNLNSEILSDLGYKASDILQANGVIWVEGPSDRIYIQCWLEEFIKNKSITLEDLDYEFMYYGGAILSHYGEESGLINILSLNKNAIIVMDNDNEFDGKHFKNPVKERIFKYYNGKNNLYSWITENYTIECYLQPSFFNKYFEYTKDLRVKTLKSKPKVSIAKKYVCNSEFPTQDLKSDNLNYHIEKMYETLLLWSE
ncbi:AAA family ATPase [Pseudoalteromonas sp.]|uniref:ATP-dependent nuclease n=1 Tax=Pseudoalteromonas sp. TaxID=53249 RepID=UPI00235694DF|nr:AAA family ATPase [Pseudoalteromonas sp.]